MISTRFLRSTVPGKPEVDVYLADAATIALLWKLKCKNGVIKEFHVTYFTLDEISKSETLTTKETKVQIEGLTAGKTFEFQVSYRLLFLSCLLPCIIYQFNDLSIGLEQDYSNGHLQGCRQKTVRFFIHSDIVSARELFVVNFLFLPFFFCFLPF